MGLDVSPKFSRWNPKSWRFGSNDPIERFFFGGGVPTVNFPGCMFPYIYLKMNGWKTIISFWGRTVSFRGELLVSGSVMAKPIGPYWSLHFETQPFHRRRTIEHFGERLPPWETARLMSVLRFNNGTPISPFTLPHSTRRRIAERKTFAFWVVAVLFVLCATSPLKQNFSFQWWGISDVHPGCTVTRVHTGLNDTR